MLGWWMVRGSIARRGRSGPYGIFLQTAILALLSRGPAHGYQLLTSLPEEGFVPRQPDIGHLYRVLRAMEARGLLTSEWALETSGPLKRVYTITPAGHEAVGRWLEDLKGLRAWLDRFLELCEREVQKDVG